LNDRDAEFLASFAENATALKDTNAAVQEFSSTYLFLKEYTAYAVEKILYIYTQLHQVPNTMPLHLKITCHVPAILTCPSTEPIGQ
jgi:hypothetical protein